MQIFPYISLQITFNCIQPQSTHPCLSLFLFSELKVPSSCTVPGENPETALWTTRSTTCSFRKWVSIWNYSWSICVYFFIKHIFFLKRKGICDKRNSAANQGRKGRQFKANNMWIPWLLFLNPDGSWFWCRTPTHKEGTEPNGSASAGGRSYKKRGCFVTAK